MKCALEGCGIGKMIKSQLKTSTIGLFEIISKKQNKNVSPGGAIVTLRQLLLELEQLVRHARVVQDIPFRLAQQDRDLLAILQK